MSSTEKIQLQLLRVWELKQIEEGMQVADDFYKKLREEIRNVVVNNKNKYKYAKGGNFADESNIDDRLNKIFGSLGE